MMLDVLIVGGGPVGTFLACELALAGVEVSVVERREQPTPHSRAMGVHARSLEIFDLRGIAEQFLERGSTRPAFHFGFLETQLDFSALDTSHPYLLALPQAQTEALLRARLQELGTTVQYGCQVIGLEQQPDHVDVTLEHAQGRSTLQAKFVVGCDGSASVVRTQAGIAFPGHDNTMLSILGEVRVSDRPSFLNVFNAEGCILAVPLGPDYYRFVTIDPQLFDSDRSAPVTLEELQASLRRIAGTDFGIHDPQWLTRFGDRSCQAELYHKGRVLLAGDAAHIHAPAGGQGLNVGLQDAMNLGWKLAAYLQGRASYEVLESYHTERYPIGEALMKNTQVQVQLMTSFSAGGRALRDWTSSLLKLEAVNRPLANQISALSTTYPPVFESQEAHPLTGTRLPNFSLKTRANNDEMLYQSFHRGNFVLLDLTTADVPPSVAKMLRERSDIKLLQASEPVTYAPLAQLQMLLVRPDGHVAWASDETDQEQRLLQLSAALSVWLA